MYKLSVIVPVYNSEQYLKKCLDSLILQTLQDIEIIIINDGSTDGSEAILKDYFNKYKDKIKLFNQTNQGQAVARNYGIKKATGEYIAFADSDDFVEKDAYETAYNYANKNRLDIVCFDFFEIKNNIKSKSNYYNGVQVTDNVKKYIVYETSPCNKIIKSSIFKKHNINFLENHIYEDLAMIPTLAKYTNKIGYINKNLYNYVIRNNSTMRLETFNEKLNDIYNVMDCLYKNFYDTPYKCELEFLYIEHLLHSASLRFLNYPEGEKEIKKISEILKTKFPNWKRNLYYNSKNIKYKIICNLLYHKHIKLVKFLLNIKTAK